MTVRRSEAPLLRSTTLTAALRDSRAALGDLQRQLDTILSTLRDPAGRPDVAAADRLNGAARAAGVAVASLTALARR